MRWMLVAMAVGCGPTDEACAEIEDDASQVVLSAISGDQPCVVAEDCEVVAVAGSCFDNCSRVIAVANRSVFEAAVVEAEGVCEDYDGCTLIIPPCSPPEDATCGDDGQCQGG